MASTSMTLAVEMDEMRDAVARLREIHGRLAKRHGDDFRKLDREIEQFIEDPEGGFEVHWLGGGKFFAAPAGKFTEIFCEARRLGVMD